MSTEFWLWFALGAIVWWWLGLLGVSLTRKWWVKKYGRSWPSWWYSACGPGTIIGWWLLPPLMPIVMILRGKADGSPTPGDGLYLRDFDFEHAGGRGMISMTGDIKKAKRFKSMPEALDYWHRQPECKPIREDGEPNRPLTATNWEFKTVRWLN